MPRPKSLSRIYKGLRPHIEEVTKATMINPDFYEISLRAALAKSFDFNEHVAKKSTIGHSFYLTATLRGVCEDLIALTSFHHLPKDERSKLIQNIQLLSCFEGMKTQEDFFQKNRPWQTVPCYKDIDDLVQDKKTELVDLYKELKLVVGKQKSPRVKDLAERAGLLALYEFIYSATSRWVHFNPHVLLRMGWTKDVDFLSGIYTFSPSHFSVYYFAFNQYYGAYLFKLFYDTFASELGIDSGAEKWITELKRFLDSNLMWPEAVTFEEMNLERPHIFFYALSRLRHENPDISDDEIKELLEGVSLDKETRKLTVKL